MIFNKILNNNNYKLRIFKKIQRQMLHNNNNNKINFFFHKVNHFSNTK